MTIAEPRVFSQQELNDFRWTIEFYYDGACVHETFTAWLDEAIPLDDTTLPEGCCEPGTPPGEARWNGEDGSHVDYPLLPGWKAVRELRQVGQPWQINFA